MPLQIKDIEAEVSHFIPLPFEALPPSPTRTSSPRSPPAFPTSYTSKSPGQLCAGGRRLSEADALHSADVTQYVEFNG